MIEVLNANQLEQLYNQPSADSTPQKLAQFQRAIQNQVILSDLLSDVNQTEQPILDDWVNTTRGLQRLFSTTILYTYRNIRENGTVPEKNQASDMLSRLNIFQTHGIISIDILPTESLARQLAEFGTEQEALDYQNKYM